MRDVQAAFPGMMQWSTQQEDIFDWFRSGSGNLVVRALAGSGKTTSLLQAIFYAPEEKILLAAFNKRIQEEMNSRLRNRRANAKTLHALGYMFLLKHWPGVDVDSSGERAEGLVRRATFELWSKLFPEAEQPASIDLVQFNESVVRLGAKILTSARDVAPFARTEDEVLDVIFDLDMVPEPYHEVAGWTAQVLARITVKAMEFALERTNKIDFADMVYIPLRNGWVKGTYDMVCIDEAQDLNLGQLELAVRACKSSGRIAVIGDSFQAIYGFRGADSNSMDRLKRELNASELGLTTTYRCPKRVVEYANTLVPALQAREDAPDGEVTSVRAEDLHKLVKPGDFVLSRSNAPLTKACLSLIRKGLRARIVGREIGQRLVNIAKKLKAYDVETFYEKLSDWASKEIARAKKAKRESRVQLICDQADTLRALLFGLDNINALYARIDDMFGDPTAAYVICSTVHRAKGLESDRVFVLQDTLYPGKFGKDKQEEQNIEYVAVTRAKKHLIWVNGFNPKKRFSSSNPQPWEDSRFTDAPWDAEMEDPDATEGNHVG